MGRGQGGSGIEFGKIKLFSSEEGTVVSDLKSMLDNIIKEHGYPEEEKFPEDDETGEEPEPEEEKIPTVDEIEEVKEEESPWMKARKK